MDNGQKAVMIGVGIFLTILVISVVLLVTNLGLDLATSGTARMTGISGMVKIELFKSQFLEDTTRYTKVSEAFNEYADKLYIIAEGTGTNSGTNYHSNTTSNINYSSSTLYFVRNSTAQYYYKTDNLYDGATEASGRRLTIAAGANEYSTNKDKYNNAVSYKRYFIHKTNDPTSDIIGLYFKPIT